MLGYDDAQKIMVQRVGAQAVLSDISNFAAKFNNGQVDMVGAPAYAYKPLELNKGLNLISQNKLKYQKILSDGRMNLTKHNIYDAGMMSVLKKARCSVDKANFECSMPGE